MIADAMTSIKAYLYEKAVSPLLGSLIISWSFWNYKFIFLWISGMKFSEKLRYINVLYSSNYEIYWQGMILPFATSMLYLFVFPYPAKWVYSFSLTRQEEMNKVKNELQNNELLTLEQSRAIKHQLADVEKELDDQLQRKDRAIESRDRTIVELKSQIEGQAKQLETLTKMNKDSTKEPSDVVAEKMIEAASALPPKREAPQPKTITLEDKVKQFIDIGMVSAPKTEDEYYAKILLSIYDTGGVRNKNAVLNQFDDKTKAQYYLDELVRKKNISHSGMNHADYTMSHTLKGYFVKHM